MRRVTMAALLLVAIAAASGSSAGAGQGASAAPQVGGCPVESSAFHVCALAKAITFSPPRLPDGTPNFQGYWLGRHNGAATNIEPSPGGFALPASTGVIVDPPDKLVPYQPWALARRNGLRTRSFDDPQAHCAPSGSPRKNFTNFGWKIVQVPGHVLVLYESMHDYRIIPTDGRPHLPRRLTTWHGDPVGRWEGNTLVVDFTNLNGKHWLDMSGNFQSDNVHVIERYTLIGADTIHFEATIEDPTVYTRPWTLAMAFARNTEDGYYQLEYACHEGERDLQHLK